MTEMKNTLVEIGNVFAFFCLLSVLFIVGMPVLIGLYFAPMIVAHAVYGVSVLYPNPSIISIAVVSFNLLWAMALSSILIVVTDYE